MTASMTSLVMVDGRPPRRRGGAFARKSAFDACKPGASSAASVGLRRSRSAARLHSRQYAARPSASDLFGGNSAAAFSTLHRAHTFDAAGFGALDFFAGFRFDATRKVYRAPFTRLATWPRLALTSHHGDRVALARRRSGIPLVPQSPREIGPVGQGHTPGVIDWMIEVGGHVGAATCGRVRRRSQSFGRRR